MTLILGCDVGLSGALAFYDTEAGSIEVHDMPVHNLARNGKAKREIDAYGLARLIDGRKGEAITAAYVERVGSMPGQGVSSCFSFGKSAGIIIGVLAANFIPIIEVAPVTWKRGIGLQSGCGKDAARALASRMFPRSSSFFARVKDDGRAESVLIALYGSRERAKVAA